MDWLAKHSPMTVDWEQQWMSFPLHGQSVTIQGASHVEFAYTIIELSVVTDENAPAILPEIQELIEEYKDAVLIPRVKHSKGFLKNCPNRYRGSSKDFSSKEFNELKICSYET